MTLSDEQDPTRGSGGGGLRIARPATKRNAADKEGPARQPDPLRRVVSTTGPERAPDFFCVGGDPTSMSQLCQMLRSHPDIGVPIAPNAKHSSKAGSDARFGDLAAIADLLAEPSAVSAETARQIATELRLAIGTDRAYLRIFGGLPHKVVGEVSSHPSMLATAGVRRMQRLAPAAKVILLLDDPIERVISTATAAMASSDAEVNADAIGERASRLAASKQTISAGIEHHRVAFGDQLYVAFREDIVSRPAPWLESMASIIGVDWKAAKDTGGIALESAAAPNVTTQLRRDLYASLAEEYTALAELYPEAVARWRSRQEELIGS